jgi:hypothetical protein
LAAVFLAGAACFAGVLGVVAIGFELLKEGTCFS